MSQSSGHSLESIAQHAGARLGAGADPGITISGVCGITDDLPDHVSFVNDERHADAACSSAIPAFVVREDGEISGKANLIHPEPEFAIARIAELFVRPVYAQSERLHPTAVIAPSAILEDSVVVGPHCVVGNDAHIGAHSRLYPGAKVFDRARLGEGCVLHANTVVREDCVLGARVILQPGAVIGGDGYGYVYRNGEHVKIPQVGHVVLEDDVEIGANTTIDRGRFTATYVGRGTKIDNLVMLGHNVRTGERCLLVSQTGISGSTQLGDDVIMAGQVGVNGHINIASGVTFLGQSMVTKDVSEPGVWAGQPVRPVRIWRRAVARFYKGLGKR